VGETLALRPSDLDVELGMVRVRHGRGDRARTVAIDPSAQAYVERWLARRDALGLNGRQPLFCTITRNDRFGAALDSSYVRRLLPRLAERAGIERRVHPHALVRILHLDIAQSGALVKAVRMAPDRRDSPGRSHASSCAVEPRSGQARRWRGKGGYLERAAEDNH
jgi:site-specific recombinase XerD